MAIAAAANPIPSASCALGRNIIYGCGSSLIQWNVDNNLIDIVDTVDGRIECITPTGDGKYAYIGTNSGNVYFYNSHEITLKEKLNESINCIAVNDTTLVCGCMDGIIYVFQNFENLIKLEIKGYALCAAICENLLVVGGTAAKLFVFDLTTSEMVSLEGHENWIRSLSFKKDDDLNYTLASASQERYIRLWKFTKEHAEENVFSTHKKISDFTISFEALLMGHDDWVLSVSWDTFGSNTLLSASSDSSLIIWKAEDSEIWTPDTRLGDVSQWGASTATGTSGGFWTGIWMEDRVVTITITGSWRVWLRPQSDGEQWVATVGPTGHLKDVTDVSWLTESLFFTTSLDQTSRLWFLQDDNHIVEIGRPQIHGYDMIALVPLSNKFFVSAGDEKVMRVFELPKQVALQIKKLNGTELSSDANLPDTASVPVLGLSNKSEADETTELPMIPREDELQKFTLWPEIDKLYGHGYEVCAISHSADQKTIISCCKANNEQHAKLRFCSTETWLEVGEPASGHSLTVTNLQVSPNGKKVLSVSRDRKFMLTDIESHKVEIDFPKAHARIIWDCCFLNDEEFITVSRDKTAKIWHLDELKSTFKLDAAGTAVDFKNGKVAIGLETGVINVYNLNTENYTLDLHSSFTVPGRVNSLQINKNGKYIAVASKMVTVNLI